MILAAETVAEEAMEFLMSEVTAEDVEKEVENLDEDTADEVLEEAVAHMKMELTSQMSPVTLKIWIGLHSETIQGKVSLRTRYTQRYLRIKRCTTSTVSAEKNNDNCLISQIITGVQNASQNEPILSVGVP